MERSCALMDVRNNTFPVHFQQQYLQEVRYHCGGGAHVVNLAVVVDVFKLPFTIYLYDEQTVVAPSIHMIFS
jgi:hypothetical protein